MRRKPPVLIPPLVPMPPRVRSLIGARFGRLVVKFFAGLDKHRKSFWCCQCDCGNYCRVLGSALLGRKRRGDPQVSCGCLRADPGIRLAARLKMPQKRRAEICEKMRKAVKRRKPAYSMDAHRACELLGVTLERLRIMCDTEEIGHTTRKGALWVSSHDVSAILAERERQKKRCPIREMMRGTKV